MSQRRFRLAGLLRLRKLQEEQAAAELGRAIGTRERALARAEKARRELGGHSVPEAVDVATWRAVVAARSALHQNVVMATAVVTTAEHDVTEREDAWQETRVRMVPLEKLAEKHEQRVTAEDLRAEQIVLDEAASRRAVSPTGGELS